MIEKCGHVGLAKPFFYCFCVHQGFFLKEEGRRAGKICKGVNPLLLKPERDTHSQVVLMGQVSEALSALPWRGRSERVWPQIAEALDALRAENDVVVIEGAGSPAEINLMASDIVNLRVARHAGRAGDEHGHAFSTFTAQILNSGCRDTGSTASIVSLLHR